MRCLRLEPREEASGKLCSLHLSRCGLDSFAALLLPLLPADLGQLQRTAAPWGLGWKKFYFLFFPKINPSNLSRRNDTNLLVDTAV